MKSKTLKILVIVLILLGALYFVATYFVGSIARTAVNRLGPEITQTKVVLGGAEISPISGSGTLTNLYVGNPLGWASDKALSVGRIHVEIEPTSLFKDHIVVKDLEVEDAEFVYETKVVSSNIGKLLQQVEHATGSGDTSVQAKDKSGKPLKFVVKHFKLSGGNVTLGVGPTALRLPMPPIELHDLGGDEGVTSDQLTLAIMRAVSASIVQTTVQAAGKVGSTMGAAAGDAAKKAAAGLGGLFGH